MAISKNLLFLLVLLTGLIHSKRLTAQETTTENKWMVGANIGIKLFLDCGGDCFDHRSVAAMQSKSAFVHFRVLQWLGLTAGVDHFRLQNYTTNSLWSPRNNNLIPFAQVDVKSNMFYASIGPQFLFRLGQGDLGLEARLGIGFNAMRLDALSIVGDDYAIKYKSIRSNIRTLQLSYVYWPKPQLGVSISVASTSTDDATFDPVTTSIRSLEIKTPIEEVNPEIDPVVLSLLSLSPTGAFIVNLSLGLTYRFGFLKNLKGTGVIPLEY